jgi:hypothetical protein
MKWVASAYPTRSAITSIISSVLRSLRRASASRPAMIQAWTERPVARRTSVVTYAEER